MSNLGFAISGRPTGQDILANGLFLKLGIEDSLYFSGLSGDIILEPGEQVAVIAQRKGNGEEQAIIIALFEYAESYGPNRPGGFIGAAVALRGLPKPQLLGKVIFDLFKSAVTLIDPTTRKFKNASKNEWNLGLPAPDDNLLGNFPSWFLKSPLKTDERIVIQTVGDLRLILWSIAQAAILNPQFNGKGTIMVTAHNSFVSKAVTKGIPKFGMFELFDYQILHERQSKKLGDAQRELSQAKLTNEQEAKVRKTLEEQSSQLRHQISEREDEVRRINKRKTDIENEINQLEQRKHKLQDTNKKLEQSRIKENHSHHQNHHNDRQSNNYNSQIETDLREYKIENRKLIEQIKLYKYIAISACFTLVVILFLYAMRWPPFQETVVNQSPSKPSEQQEKPAQPEKAKITPLDKEEGKSANKEHRDKFKNYINELVLANDFKSVEAFALRGVTFRDALMWENSKITGAGGSLKSDYDTLISQVLRMEALLKTHGIQWQFGSLPDESPKANLTTQIPDSKKNEIITSLRKYNLLFEVPISTWELQEMKFKSNKIKDILKQYLESPNDIYNINNKEVSEFLEDSLMMSHLRWMIMKFNKEMDRKKADISLSSETNFKVPVLKK